jgi:hypothetical protein
MATAPKFRIDVDIHDLLMNSAAGPAKLPVAKPDEGRGPEFRSLIPDRRSCLPDKPRPVS